MRKVFWKRLWKFRKELPAILECTEKGYHIDVFTYCMGKQKEKVYEVGWSTVRTGGRGSTISEALLDFKIRQGLAR